MHEIKNAYSDEQARLEEQKAERDLVLREVREVLSRHNYDVDIELIHGFPHFRLVKLG